MTLENLNGPTNSGPQTAYQAPAMRNMEGKICIVTGATSGIGLATAEGLATKGARVILVGRDPAKGDAALRRIRRRLPQAVVEVHIADLSRLDELRRLAASLRSLPRIDVLVNNAGAMFKRRRITADGLECTFALNHMAYFVLTGLLGDVILRSAPARVVVVASEAHRGATLHFDDLQSERDYSGWTVYQRSKLCNVLFTRALAQLWKDRGVTANSVDPGFVASRFGENNGGITRLNFWLNKRLHHAASIEQGAATSIYLASSPDVDKRSGDYFKDCAPAAISTDAQDGETARRLWEKSARIAPVYS
jgi:NAD(P)-dependent dehydrogenase (short-subunit alcohol dehydrogenase family)